MNKIITYNQKECYVENKGKRVYLSKNECKLLELFVKFKTIKNEEISKYYTGKTEEISRLRKRTGLNIKSIYGTGYYLVDKVEVI